MHKNKALFIGTVSKLHGYKGKVKIFILKKINFDFNVISYLLIKNNNDLVPYIIEYAKVIKENMMLVKFDDVNNEEEAKNILKKDVYISTKFVDEKQFIGKTFLFHSGSFGVSNHATQVGKRIYGTTCKRFWKT